MYLKPCVLVALIATLACDSTGPGTAISVDNQSLHEVVRLYLQPCEASGWGADRLGAETLRPKARRSFAVSAGCWDMRFESAQTFGIWLNTEVTEGQTVNVTLESRSGCPLCAEPR
jgi:hypothetical protein